MKVSDLVVLFYITAILFALQRLTFRSQAVIESAHVAVQLTIVTVIATNSDLSRCSLEILSLARS